MITTLFSPLLTEIINIIKLFEYDHNALDFIMCVFDMRRCTIRLVYLYKLNQKV